MLTFRVAVRPKGPGQWLNLYANRSGSWQAGGIYPTRRMADDIAKPHRAACVFVSILPIPKR